MSIAVRRLAVAVCLATSAQLVSAQTADEVIEKSITAVGGRAALGKLHSRTTTGTITLITPAGDATGSIEIYNAEPNKVRTLIKADLSALGAGELILDQRFDGSIGYVLDTLQGNRDMTGNQLDNMRNGAFPHPFLKYKALGMSATLRGTEKIDGRDAYLLVFEPPTGSVVRQFLDAQTYLPVRTVVQVNVPQLGREIEQTTDFLDYREVDGVKLPFQLRASSAIQSYTITVEKVEHNVAIDTALFSKPK